MTDSQKSGEDENTKIWKSREWKSFLDEIKTFFIVFEGLSYGQK